MKLNCACFVILFILCNNLSSCLGYNILGIFHTTSETQHLIGSSLMKELAGQGHNVTTVSPFHLETTVDKYTEIVLDGVLARSKVLTDEYRGLKSSNFIKRLLDFYNAGHTMTATALQHPKFQNLLQSNASFDLIIIDAAMNEAMEALGQHFRAPLIKYDTSGMKLFTHDFKGQSISLSSLTMREPIIGNAGFYDRLTNVFAYAAELLYLKYIHLPRQEELASKLLLPSKIPLLEPSNVPLFRFNRHFGTNYNKNKDIVEIQNISPQENKMSIPKQLQKVLDSAKQGAIYVSFDLTNYKLSNETIESIVKSLGKRKEEIIWKTHSKESMSMPENIFIDNAVPECSILAHPNVKLVIAEVTFLNVLNSITNGVPMIGITEYLEQSHNLAPAVEAGLALEIDFYELDEAYLDNVIEDVLSKPIYLKLAKLYSKHYQEQPQNSVQAAASWVEYIARNPDLYQSRITRSSFIEECNADIIAFVLLLAAIWAYIFSQIVKKFIVIIMLFYLNVNVKEKEL